MPDFGYFHLGTKVAYGLPVSWLYFAEATTYGLVLSCLFILLSGILFQKKEL